MSRAIRLWPQPSRGDLQPGRDIALTAPPALAGTLAPGTLLDDHLDLDSRVAIETEARRRTAVWLSARRAALQVDGIDLAWVWEVEIYRQAVLPAVRLVTGVGIAAAALGTAVECPELDDAEASALADAGVEVRGGQGSGALAIPSDTVWMPLYKRLAIRARVPVPQLVRGSVRVLNHWALEPLVRPLAADGRLVPVLDPGLLHRLPRGELAELAWRGGWIGAPGPLRRARSERMVRTVLGRLDGRSGDALDRLVDARARALLAERAIVTPSLVDRQRRAFARGRIRVLVVPFDSVAPVRAILVAAREHGVPSLLVQHGLAGSPDDPDMRESDHVAVWDERQAERVARNGPRVSVTGNPAAPERRRPRRPPSTPGRTLLLVQPPTPFSVRLDARVSRRSVDVGLSALAAARPGSTVVLRPHPLDPTPHAYATSVSGVRVEVDRSSPIEALIAASDLCIGGVSTALLQAAAMGVPVVFLDLTAMAIAWPLDGTTSVPVATDVAGLRDQVERALAADDVLGGEELATALGVRPGALERLVELTAAVAEGGRPGAS